MPHNDSLTDSLNNPNPNPSPFNVGPTVRLGFRPGQQRRARRKQGRRQARQELSLQDFETITSQARELGVDEATIETFRASAIRDRGLLFVDQSLFDEIQGEFTSRKELRKTSEAAVAAAQTRRRATQGFNLLSLLSV